MTFCVHRMKLAQTEVRGGRVRSGVVRYVGTLNPLVAVLIKARTLLRCDA